MKKVILVIALCILNWFIVMPKSFTPAYTTIHEAYGLGVICQDEHDMKIRNLKLWENGIGIFTAIIIGIFTAIILLSSLGVGVSQLTKKKE